MRRENRNPRSDHRRHLCRVRLQHRRYFVGLGTVAVTRPKHRPVADTASAPYIVSLVVRSRCTYLPPGGTSQEASCWYSERLIGDCPSPGPKVVMDI